MITSNVNLCQNYVYYQCEFVSRLRVCVKIMIPSNGSLNQDYVYFQ